MDAESYRRFLIPGVLSKLKGMELKAKLVVEGFLTGLHRSPYKGFSVEFAEHRPYMPGDEIKRIDWKIFGKTDRFYIKEFEEETNLKAYIFLDASGSMRYTSTKLTKLEYGSYLSASLVYLLLRQKDSVGLCIFDNKIRKYIAPKSSPRHLHIILKELDEIKPGGETDLGSTFHQIAERIKRRGLIIIISDLFDEPSRVLLGLKHFRHRKNEVIVFHILDPAEIHLPSVQPCILKDLESKEELQIEPKTAVLEYEKNFKVFVKRYRRECRENLIDYIPLNTLTPFDYALLSYLGKRKRLF